MARTRNHKAEYQRKLELRAAKGKTRDYAYEYELSQKRAQAEGFPTPRTRRQYRKEAEPKGVPKEEFLKNAVFKKFGIKNKAEFDRLRRENRNYFTDNAQLAFGQINRYREDIDSDIHNFGVKRVGYIKSFNDAMVNPKHNYQSLVNNPGFYEGSGKARKKGNTHQFWYLVQYSGIMDAAEYYERYGEN